VQQLNPLLEFAARRSIDERTNMHRLLKHKREALTLQANAKWIEV
jgi:vacuolar-type H+-ATPase subunit D/Vma8